MPNAEPKNWYPVIFMLLATACFYVFLVSEYGMIIKENENLREQISFLNESNEKMNETIEKLEEKLINTRKSATVQGN